jgi:hypothetical protein
MKIPRYYCQGKRIEDLQAELKSQGWLYVTRCERNSPYLPQITLTSDQIRIPEVFCIYTHKTKLKYFNVIDFANFNPKTQTLEPANFRKDQRKLLNKHAIFQPEFESYM